MLFKVIKGQWLEQVSSKTGLYSLKKKCYFETCMTVTIFYEALKSQKPGKDLSSVAIKISGALYLNIFSHSFEKIWKIVSNFMKIHHTR